MQSAWLCLIQEFEFGVEHVPGRMKIFLDLKSRRPDRRSPILMELKSMSRSNTDFSLRIKTGYELEMWAIKTLSVLRDGKPCQDRKVQMTLSNCKYRNGIGCNKTKTDIPKHNGLRNDVI